MLLSPWQKISRVLPARPFGDGRLGNATISTDVNTRTTFVRTGLKTGTAGNTSLQNGDVVVIVQYQYTPYGAFEFNMVTGGGGTTALTFQQDLKDSYGPGAQIIRVPMYKAGTISTHSLTAWNGSTGGLGIIAAKKMFITGSWDIVAKGFRGGNPTGNNQGFQGESSAGPGGQSRAQNRQSGGAGGNWGTGGGAGAKDPGETAPVNGGPFPGFGGDQAGVDDLTVLIPPGAGGAGSYNNNTGRGGHGSGILIVIARQLIITGAISGRGEMAPNVSGIVGGSAAGASILFMIERGDLGADLVDARGGVANTSANTGGKGSDGFIAVHHSRKVTGTTLPMFTDIKDKTLRELLPSAALMLKRR